MDGSTFDELCQYSSSLNTNNLPTTCDISCQCCLHRHTVTTNVSNTFCINRTRINKLSCTKTLLTTCTNWGSCPRTLFSSSRMFLECCCILASAYVQFISTTDILIRITFTANRLITINITIHLWLKSRPSFNDTDETVPSNNDQISHFICFLETP